MSALKLCEISTYWLCDIHLRLGNLRLLICLSEKNRKKVFFLMCVLQIKKGPKSEHHINFAYLLLLSSPQEHITGVSDQSVCPFCASERRCLTPSLPLLRLQVTDRRSGMPRQTGAGKQQCTLPVILVSEKLLFP